MENYSKITNKTDSSIQHDYLKTTTLRDEMALAVMVHLFESTNGSLPNNMDTIAVESYKMADSMIRAREKVKPDNVPVTANYIFSLNDGKVVATNTWVKTSSVKSCQIPKGTVHRVKFANGTISSVCDFPDSWEWEWDSDKYYNIVAFMILDITDNPWIICNNGFTGCSLQEDEFCEVEFNFPIASNGEERKKYKVGDLQNRPHDIVAYRKCV